ncbi:MAG: tetratricopeptide repeat protein [Candidatus Limnocylindrales bacterium]
MSAIAAGSNTMNERQIAAGSSGRRSRLVGALFVVGLVIVVAVGFILLGPPSQRTSAQRLAEMAPPGAGSGQYVAPQNATATETEIAKRYNTVREFPDTTAAYVLLGYAYLQHVREVGDPSDYGRAGAALTEARQRDPKNVDAIIGLGVLALARHEFSVGLDLGRAALVLAPRSARAHGVIVDALTELGRYDEAVASSQEMVDLRPDLASLSRVAYQRELHGDVDGAISAMSRAYDASAGTSLENREYLRVLIGDLHLLKGDLVTARQIYAVSLDASPGFVWALAGLARVETAQTDYESAIDHYQQAVIALPAPELFVALGEAQQAAGLETEARQTYEIVGAQQQLFAANGVNVDLELALFEANHGDPSTAVNLATSAYASQPNVKAADALAWALYRADRSVDAQKYATEALRLGGVQARPLYHAAMIEITLGEVAAAREHLTAALAAEATLSPLEAAAARSALSEL